MKRIASVVTVVVCIGYLTFGYWGIGRHAPKNTPQVVDSTQVTDVARSFEDVRLYGSWVSGSLIVDKYGIGVGPPTTSDGGNDDYGVFVRRGEFVPGSLALEEYVEEYSTSYRVVSADLLWTSHLLIHGVSDAGRSVGELWTFPPVVGEWVATAVSSPTGPGIPQPPLPSHSVAIEGGTYIPQADRADRGRVRRKSVFRSGDLIVKDVALDRDLRVVHLLAENALGVVGCYIVDLTVPGAAPQMVVDSTTYPELIAAEYIGADYAPGMGRAITVYLEPDLDPDPSKNRAYTLLWDLDNNCLPDFVESLSNTDFDMIYPDGSFVRLD